MASARPLIGVVASALAGGMLFLGADLFARPGYTSCPSYPRPAVDRAQVIARARALIEAERYEEAKALLDRSAIDWGSDVGELAALCAMEIEAKRGIELASANIDAEAYADARYQLQHKVPYASKRGEQRRQLEAELSATADRLLVEAEQLSGMRHDREKMVELQRVSAQLLELEPDLALATELSQIAEDALEDIDSPYVVVERMFEDGDVAGALKKAKSCASAFVECEELVEPLARLTTAKPKLGSLQTSRLLELKQTAREISSSGDGIEEDIDAVLSRRYAAAAKRCQSSGDWACVDRQLAAAMESQVSYDEEIEDALNAWAKETVTRAYSQRSRDPKTTRAVLQRVVKMQMIESRWRQLAQRLDEHISAGR